MYKPYYDVLSYLITQAAFSFTTAPFVLLTLPDSLLVWSRVYFYVVFGVAASTAFFASPAKGWLIKKLETRNKPALQPKEKTEHPLMGLPNDPGKDIDEAVREIREEVEARRRGTSVSKPTGEDMKSAMEEKLGKKL